MNLSFSPSLEFTLSCPRRFHLEKLHRERTLAPFAASELGIQVHRRIAHSLRKGQPADEGPFCLPKRLILQADESLDDLIWRASTALSYFNGKCRSWLKNRAIGQVEHYISQPYRLKESLKVAGVIDLVLGGREGDGLIDWKTGGVAYCEGQLKFYLMLRYLEMGQAPRRAEAVSLSSGEVLCIEWDDAIPEWFEMKLTGMKRKLAMCRTKLPVTGGHCKYCPYAKGCEVGEAPERYLLDTWTGELTKLTGVTHANL